jgi:hypothetical protein
MKAARTVNLANAPCGARSRREGPALIRLTLTVDEGKLAILVRTYCSGAP